MPWEFFDPSLAKNKRGRSHSGAPLITISSAGRFFLNVAAYKLLSRPAAPRLLYDAEDRRIGFEAADVGDPHAYKFSQPTLGLSGTSLLKAHRISHEESRRYQAKMQGKTVFIELDEHDGPRGRSSRPLGLLTAPPLEVWEELAEEAERYLKLLRAWKEASPEEREVLEPELLGSLSHLRVHTQVMDEDLEEAMELADRLDEEPRG